MVAAKRTRNVQLVPGVNKYGRAQASHNRGTYKVKKLFTTKTAAKGPAKKVKKVGGAKNGATREIKSRPGFYTTHPVKVPLKNHKTNKVPALRKSLSPGTVAIVLAGPFAGKRVVVLKGLDSGLALITGPYKINGVPLRRVAPAYLMATSTKVDVAGLAVPANINDAYFVKPKAPVAKKTEGEFFGQAKKAAPKVLGATRAADQKAVDAPIIKAIGKKTDLFKYIKAHFTLTNGQYPHELKF